MWEVVIHLVWANSLLVCVLRVVWVCRLGLWWLVVSCGVIAISVVCISVCGRL